MSKHPTSELSPRDRACIKYGRWLAALRRELLIRHENIFARMYARYVIREAREARERIFRFCFECEHCEIEAGYCCKPGKEPRELTWQYEDACMCEHYEERRGA